MVSIRNILNRLRTNILCEVFLCLLSSHIHVCSEQYLRQREIEREKIRHETERLERFRAVTEECVKISGKLMERKRRKDFKMRMQHVVGSLYAQKDAM